MPSSMVSSTLPPPLLLLPGFIPVVDDFGDPLRLRLRLARLRPRVPAAPRRATGRTLAGHAVRAEHRPRAPASAAAGLVRPRADDEARRVRLVPAVGVGVGVQLAHPILITPSPFLAISVSGPRGRLCGIG